MTRTQEQLERSITRHVEEERKYRERASLADRDGDFEYANECWEIAVLHARWAEEDEDELYRRAFGR